MLEGLGLDLNLLINFNKAVILVYFFKIYTLTLKSKSLYRPAIGVGGLREEMPVMLKH